MCISNSSAKEVYAVVDAHFFFLHSFIDMKCVKYSVSPIMMLNFFAIFFFSSSTPTPFFIRKKASMPMFDWPIPCFVCVNSFSRRINSSSWKLAFIMLVERMVHCNRSAVIVNTFNDILMRNEEAFLTDEQSNGVIENCLGGVGNVCEGHLISLDYFWLLFDIYWSELNWSYRFSIEFRIN